MLRPPLESPNCQTPFDSCHRVQGFHPEVVTGATQWRDQTQARQADENRLEVDHVIGPVERTDPASARIPEGKLSLKTADTRIICDMARNAPTARSSWSGSGRSSASKMTSRSPFACW